MMGPRVCLPPWSVSSGLATRESTVTRPPLAAWMSPPVRVSVLPAGTFSSAPPSVAVVGPPTPSARSTLPAPVSRALSSWINGALALPPVNRPPLETPMALPPRVWLPPWSVISEVLTLGSTLTCPPFDASMNPPVRFRALPLPALSSAPPRFAVAVVPSARSTLLALVGRALSRSIRGAFGLPPVNWPPSETPRASPAIASWVPLTARNSGPSRVSRLGFPAGDERPTPTSAPAESTVEASNTRSGAPFPPVCASDEPPKIPRNELKAPRVNEVLCAVRSDPCTLRLEPSLTRSTPVPAFTLLWSRDISDPRTLRLEPASRRSTPRPAFRRLRSADTSAGMGAASRRAEPRWITLALVVSVLSDTTRRRSPSVAAEPAAASSKLLFPETVDGSIDTTGWPAGQMLVPVNVMTDCPGGNAIVWFSITTHPGHRGGGGGGGGEGWFPPNAF